MIAGGRRESLVVAVDVAEGERREGSVETVTPSTPNTTLPRARRS